MDEIEHGLLEAMAAALDADGVPMMMIPYSGPPPNAEFYLDLLRYMIERTGGATGCITFGTSDGSSGMFPLVNIDPQLGMSLLIAMRANGLIASVSWVTVASDTYRRVVDDDTDASRVQKGDMELMRMLGDTKVEDVLMVLCVAPDGPNFDLYQKYTKTETGIEWEDVRGSDVPPSGALVELMQTLVAA